MNQQANPFIKADGTKPSCMQMLQSILDGEATVEQKAFFRGHMDRCMPCFKNYEVDITIKEMLKMKCRGEEVPKELINQLKDQIKQLTTS